MRMITLTGQVPSKKNSRINTRSGRSFPSKRYSEWHKIALEQLKNEEKLPEKVGIEYTFYQKDNRRRDISNQLESINDLLVDAGLLIDDDWQHLFIYGGKAELAKDRMREPGCTIIVYER